MLPFFLGWSDHYYVLLYCNFLLQFFNFSKCLQNIINFINTFGVLGKTEVSNIMARGRDKPYEDSRFKFFSVGPHFL